MSVIVPEHQIGAEVSVSDVGREGIRLVVMQVCQQAVPIREKWLDATLYHLQHCIMPDIIAPEM